jgi:DNA-binding HxlR family transcriptional regulator
MKDERWAKGDCFIARALARIGDAWTMLILRDASRGLGRFDDFRVSLGIAPNILTRRLGALVEAGLLERVAYQEHPPRFRYVLTDSGRDFLPVLHVMGAWGRRHLSDPGEHETGHHSRIRVIDADTGAPIDTSRPVFP